LDNYYSENEILLSYNKVICMQCPISTMLFPEIGPEPRCVHYEFFVANEKLVSLFDNNSWLT